ncbi:sigma-70 family RNA polymerase sigma factor [Paenibacillus sp. FSL R7-0297]|uniref:RNA polymerase sigma factor n=1 Tax=unclassified Paenibacillus TaxID=185978 RepID=UPI0004F71F9D|nr:sigma-70 family RNA polymerase sigma factor [Paenibacillus sp. FSL R5-0912]AIQ40643.1 hypothetical protein R50912_11895 [Paenibacillus sp. FSL R5-0912]
MFQVLPSFKSKEKLKFENLYTKYRYLLYKCAFDILKRQNLAEDATSEAFIRIFKNLDKINENNEKETIGFMVIIVKNISLTMLSNEKRNKTLFFQEIDEDIEEHFNLEDAVISNHQYKEIVEAISKLKVELEAPFLLRYVYGYSSKEIAEILCISINNVDVRIYRAKKALADILGKRGLKNG